MRGVRGTRRALAWRCPRLLSQFSSSNGRGSGMLAGHRILGTWRDQVNAYIVFTEFFRQKFIRNGLPREKIFVKPHFLGTDPGMKQNIGDYALFLGRLAPGKGGAHSA